MKASPNARDASSSDPTDITALGHYLKESDPDGRLGALGMSRLIISDRAHFVVADVVSEAFKDGDGQSPHTVAVLYDKTNIGRDGQISKAVTDELATISVKICMLMMGRGTHASEAVLNDATTAIAEAGLLVMGSGTIPMSARSPVPP